VDGHVKVSGAWKKLNGIHVKVSGTWKAVNNAYVNVSGVWKQFYQAAAFLLDLGDNAFYAQDSDGFPVTGTLAVNSDGSIAWTGDTGGTSESGHTWFSPVGATDGTGWHVKLSYTSGTNQYNSGSGLATWLALTTGRTWTFRKASVGGPDQTDGVYLLEFSDDGGSTTYASVSINDISLFEQTP